MIETIIRKVSKLPISKKFKFKIILEDIPDDFFKKEFNSTKNEINFSIFFLSFFISLFFGLVLIIYDLIFGLFIFVICYLCILLLFIRKIRKIYLDSLIQVEQFSDLICKEILLVYTSTNSLSIIIDYLSKGNYPIISEMLKEYKKRLNLGESPALILKEFALNQPSESVSEFILEILIPLSEGYISNQRNINFEPQWRIRQNFESYLSQIEGKMSLFLAITTIIPITVSMLLVMLGYISLNLVILLPFLFFIFDLIAIEIYNTGKIELLGGK